MATGTRLPQEDIFNKVWNPSGTGPSPTGDSWSVYLLPGSGQNTPVLGSGTFQGLGPNPLVVVQPAFRQFVLDSVTTGSAATTGTWTTGLGGYRTLVIHVRYDTITGTASNIGILIDTRLDGTNAQNLARLQNLASASGATGRQVLVLRRDVFATGTLTAGGGLLVPADIAGDATESVIRAIPWGDDLRIRSAPSGGTTAPIFTYTVTVNAIS